MVHASRGTRPPAALDVESDEPLPIDAERLPVLVAVRLSLSFPGLLSAIPLYRAGKDGVLQRCLFSDGGIASNFPVHFFDSWFPRRPTFGIDLARHPGGTAPEVVMHAEAGSPAQPSGPIESAGAFIAQILDTMQNWRDNLQAELPGYEDRVCQVRLRPGEGGLNLKMKLPAIRKLMDHGLKAGEELADALPMAPPGAEPTRNWSRHCMTRFKVLMRLQQGGLKAVSERAGDFLAALKAGRIEPGEGDGFEEWAPAAAEQTRLLLDCASAWGPPPAPVDFERWPAPTPEPVMRIVPKA
jgi:hypothetical protein